MAINLGILAQGTLPTTQSVLYQVVGKKAVAADVNLTNTGGSTVKVDLWIRTSTGTARRVIPKEMELRGQYSFSSDLLKLGVGDVIEGKGSSSVDYTISAVQRLG